MLGFARHLPEYHQWPAHLCDDYHSRGYCGEDLGSWYEGGAETTLHSDACQVYISYGRRYCVSIPRYVHIPPWQAVFQWALHIVQFWLFWYKSNVILRPCRPYMHSKKFIFLERYAYTSMCFLRYFYFSFFRLFCEIHRQIEYHRHRSLPSFLFFSAVFLEYLHKYRISCHTWINNAILDPFREGHEFYSAASTFTSLKIAVKRSLQSFWSDECLWFWFWLCSSSKWSMRASQPSFYVWQSNQVQVEKCCFHKSHGHYWLFRTNF